MLPDDIFVNIELDLSCESSEMFFQQINCHEISVSVVPRTGRCRSKINLVGIGGSIMPMSAAAESVLLYCEVLGLNTVEILAQS